jgi:hypothetical protein
MALEKLPTPVPSVVLLLEMVGFVDVLQQTPLTVTAVPPSLLMLPPDTADVSVIELMAIVVSVGVVRVVKDIWLP